VSSYIWQNVLTFWEGDRGTSNEKKKKNLFVRMLKCVCQFQGTLEHVVPCCSFTVIVHLDQTQSGGPSLVECRRAYIRYDGSYLFRRKARSLLHPRLSTRPTAKGVQLSAMHPLQIWLHPPAICKISYTNMLINQLKTCDTLSHPWVAFVEQLWLQTTHFKICVYMRDVFCNGI